MKNAAIVAMRKLFAHFVNPSKVVTDNGTRVTSATFMEFCLPVGSHIIAFHLFIPSAMDKDDLCIKRWAWTSRTSLKSPDQVAREETET